MVTTNKGEGKKVVIRRSVSKKLRKGDIAGERIARAYEFVSACTNDSLS